MLLQHGSEQKDKGIFLREMKILEGGGQRMMSISSNCCGKRVRYRLERPVVLFFGGGGFKAAPAAYGSSQPRDRTGAIAAGLHHSHSNVGSEPSLRPTPQLTATPDPTEHGQGLNLHPHGYSQIWFR